MEYSKIVTLKNGKELIIRNGEEEDGLEMYDVFMKTHIETDYNITYEDEVDFSPEEECAFLKRKKEDKTAIQLVAFLDGKMVGMANCDPINLRYKLKHRAEFGISILKDYWGLGIGRKLTQAIIECAKTLGYKQLELETVSENERALNLYKSEGFVEYGRNPKAFVSRYSGYQELVYMYKNLED